MTKLGGTKRRESSLNKDAKNPSFSTTHARHMKISALLNIKKWQKMTKFRSTATVLPNKPAKFKDFFSTQARLIKLSQLCNRKLYDKIWGYQNGDPSIARVHNL